MAPYKAFIFFTSFSLVLNVASSNNGRFDSGDIKKFLRLPDIGFKNFVPDLNLLNKLIQPQFQGNFALNKEINVRNDFQWKAAVDFEKKSYNEMKPTEFPNQSYYAYNEVTENKPAEVITKEAYLNKYYNKENQATTETSELRTDTSTTDIETTTGYDDDIMTRLDPSAVASLLG